MVQVPPGGSIQSGVYKLLTEGSLPPGHVDHPASRSLCNSMASAALEGLPFRSGYREVLGHEPPLTTRVRSGFHGTLDYIFLLGPPSLRPVEMLELPYDTACGDDPRAETSFPSYPSTRFNSDHLALGLTIEI